MLTGRLNADYFNIFCEQCGNRTENEYLGWDPAVPHFRATCKDCGPIGIFKLSNWKGLPTKPDSWE